jgi:hypothetical protein
MSRSHRAQEQFLDVAQAQLKAEIPAHSATDNLGLETVTVIDDLDFFTTPSYVTGPAA